MNRLLAQAKQDYTLLDFKGERPMVIFESPSQITESVIEHAKEHFTSRFLSEKRMFGMTL